MHFGTKFKTAVCACIFISTISYVKPAQVWPLPQSYTSTDTFLGIIPQEFIFDIAKWRCDILLHAVERYRRIIFQNGCTQGTSDKISHVAYNLHRKSISQLFNLTIEVNGDCEKYPYEGMDEEYMLMVNDPALPHKAVLLSSTVWGALRGLETFSQLVYLREPKAFVINTTSILDFPRFSHRGLLLDTSRHFLPVPVILKNIEALASTKMNVLHLHLSDDQSFPYVSKTFPEMSEKGAYNPKTHVYTQVDIANIIEYARLHGVRVLAEFDSPGHTLSWGKSRPKLLSPCLGEEQRGPIDPTREENFDFLKQFFSEIAEVFPDDHIHLGGDEVNYFCWQIDPRIREFMAWNSIGSFNQLERYYMFRLMEIVRSLNKSAVVWQEVFDSGEKLTRDTVIHIWKDGYKDELSLVTLAGLRVILSSCWYLNYINYGTDWAPFYACDPQDFVGSAKQKELVLGGESCMWAEYVDSSNQISRTWPRTSVIGERLWSNAKVKDFKKAKVRLEEYRCKMVKRGIKMQPVNGPGFCECDIY